MFANGPGDRCSIPGRVIPKTKKMVFDAPLLNTQHDKVRVKWSNPGNGVAPSPTLQFGLGFLFNGISTLFRLFNAKAILIEEQ